MLILISEQHLLLLTAFLRYSFLAPEIPKLYFSSTSFSFPFAFLGCSFSIWFLNIGCLRILSPLHSIPRCPISPVVVNIVYMPMNSLVSSPDVFSSEVQICMSDCLLHIAPLTHCWLDFWVSPPKQANKETFSFSRLSPSWVNDFRSVIQSGFFPSPHISKSAVCVLNWSISVCLLGHHPSPNHYHLLVLSQASDLFSSSLFYTQLPGSFFK